ncbi:MAG: hypothetical protein ACI8ZM_004607 [Crocinitomix sp.]|jgi:hypothetical protein
MFWMMVLIFSFIVLALITNFYQRLRYKDQSDRYLFDVESFDLAVYQGDREKTYRFGKRLVSNTNISMTVFRRVEVEVDKFASDYPEFKELQKEMLMKKRQWVID